MSKMKSVYGEPKDGYSKSLRTKSIILTVWFIILTISCLLPIYILQKVDFAKSLFINKYLQNMLFIHNLKDMR